MKKEQLPVFSDVLRLAKQIKPPTKNQMGRLITAAKTPPRQLTDLVAPPKFPNAITPRQQGVLNNVRAKNKNTGYA